MGIIDRREIAVTLLYGILYSQSQIDFHVLYKLDELVVGSDFNKE